MLKVNMKSWIVLSLALLLMGCAGEEAADSTVIPVGSETLQGEGGDLSPEEDAVQRVTPGNDGETITITDVQEGGGPEDTESEADGVAPEDSGGQQGPIECDETVPPLAAP